MFERGEGGSSKLNPNYTKANLRTETLSQAQAVQIVVSIDVYRAPFPTTCSIMSAVTIPTGEYARAVGLTAFEGSYVFLTAKKIVCLLFRICAAELSIIPHCICYRNWNPYLFAFFYLLLGFVVRLACNTERLFIEGLFCRMISK